MFNIVSKTKLKNIRKRGTYSRLLKKYRELYKQSLNNISPENEFNDQVIEEKYDQSNSLQIDSCHEENIVISAQDPEGNHIVPMPPFII